MKFTTTYFNFKTNRPDHIISGAMVPKTKEEIIEGIKAYVDSICPLEDRTDENGNDTLKIEEGARFPFMMRPQQISMRYS
ncbi:gp30.6 hypothetical protein [Aeromonas phage 31]|uniref:Uncharacterized protein n=4 Tax=Biquartavirus TaxID=1912143 RepID=Q6U9D3_9CAUD|nr:gp30.6 [Aeromonas phage 44RR2.8t]YP_238896.1 gp30.6 [Aeromonas phage 31]APU00641.1 hypothetical protein [Aeromonas phage 44RR2.8t.2]APU01061.1 hypothetical protein [Aeromonas phage 31.2]APU01971.1 hypothetical protein [Aeromonas phage L9-6]APU02223.1 hypothetical protein [Aeromonas phage Riv-10]APU02469.1 hypothetical protein [Aeromonas phage SW69-9]UYD59722.1 hypothetical protein JNMOADIG_00210 [Aeromonas phage avDM5]UYD60548.1 hypothetical protein NPHMPGLK_00213 [Aeromonas phage avDM2]